MSGFGAFMRGLFKEGFFTLIIKGLEWGAPILAPAVTTVIGYLQGIPWFYIAIGAIIAFAMMATGLLRFDEWRARITPRNKLVFKHAMFNIISVKDTATGKSTHLRKVQSILSLFNSSTFPIEYYVDEISSSMEGHINPNKLLNNRGAVLQPERAIV